MKMAKTDVPNFGSGQNAEKRLFPMLGTAVFLTLLRPYSLFYAINQSHVLQHEAHERMPLDEILLFNVQHAVDLRNPLATQFFNKCVHVAIKRFAANPLNSELRR